MLQHVAERFRFYSFLCRDYAVLSPPAALAWLSQAEKWEKAAEAVERVAECIASSVALLGRVEADLQATSAGGPDRLRRRG